MGSNIEQTSSEMYIKYLEELFKVNNNKSTFTKIMLAKRFNKIEVKYGCPIYYLDTKILLEELIVEFFIIKHTSLNVYLLELDKYKTWAYLNIPNLEPDVGVVRYSELMREEEEYIVDLISKNISNIIVTDDEKMLEIIQNIFVDSKYTERDTETVTMNEVLQFISWLAYCGISIDQIIKIQKTGFDNWICSSPEDRYEQAALQRVNMFINKETDLYARLINARYVAAIMAKYVKTIEIPVCNCQYLIHVDKNENREKIKQKILDRQQKRRYNISNRYENYSLKLTDLFYVGACKNAINAGISLIQFKNTALDNKIHTLNLSDTKKIEYMSAYEFLPRFMGRSKDIQSFAAKDLVAYFAALYQVM